MSMWLNKKWMKMQMLDGKLCEVLRETLSSHKWSCPDTKHTPEWDFFLEMAGFLKAFQGLVSVFFLKIL